MFQKTGFKFGSILITLGLAIGARPLPGQTISFSREFSSPQIDRASAITADPTGVYLFGERLTTDGRVGAVIKYDSQGNQLWTRPFSAPAPGNLTSYGLASDSTGVYALVGVGDVPQFFIRKYSAEGNGLWTREMGFASPGAFAADATGVYVVGRDFPPNFSYLRKYRPEGVVLWTTKFGGSQALENHQNLAVDPTGLYVFGIAFNFGPFLCKYDLGGNELWTRESFPVVGTLAAAIPAGLYAVGSEGSRAVLRRYDPDGNQLWSSPFTGYIAGISADATGTYVARNTRSSLPGQCRSGSGIDLFVRKYNSAGVEQWTREFGGSGSALASGVAIDAGSVYMAGQAGIAGFEDYGFLQATGMGNEAFVASFEKASALKPATPRIFDDCIVNAARYVGGGVAPGEIVTLFGSAMSRIGKAAPLSLTPWLASPQWMSQSSTTVCGRTRSRRPC